VLLKVKFPPRAVLFISLYVVEVLFGDLANSMDNPLLVKLAPFRNNTIKSFGRNLTEILVSVIIIGFL
jgi:hypothetical protein